MGFGRKISCTPLPSIKIRIPEPVRIKPQRRNHGYFGYSGPQSLPSLPSDSSLSGRWSPEDPFYHCESDSGVSIPDSCQSQYWEKKCASKWLNSESTDISAIPICTQPYRPDLPLNLDLERATIPLNNGHLSTQSRNKWTTHQVLRWALGKPYVQFVYLVLFLNAALLAWLVSTPPLRPDKRVVDTSSMATGVNIASAILTRNEFFVDGLFWISSHVGPWAPLRIRTAFAKVHTFGGVHSGCAAAGTIWYFLMSAVLVWRGKEDSDFFYIGLLGCTSFCFLVAMCITALPPLRARYHNCFEQVHRFAGWAMLGFFGVQIVGISKIEAADARIPLSLELVSNPVFWMFLVSAVSVIQPWISTRKRKVNRAEKLGERAVRLYFDGRISSCKAVRLSRNPLIESHSFASIPEPDGIPQWSVVVADAGDWTHDLVQNPPSQLWIRGRPTWGILRNAVMFSSVVIVATGTGIGPCLGLFNEYPNLRCRVLWSVRDPIETYGIDIIDSVLQADPDAMIINTRTSGRPDMVATTVALYTEAKAEAVFCISNEQLTKMMVMELESRNIPAFGPIWDS